MKKLIFFLAYICFSIIMLQASDMRPREEVIKKASLVSQGWVAAVGEKRKMLEFQVEDPIVPLTEAQAKRIAAVLGDPANYQKEALFSLQKWGVKFVLTDKNGSFTLEFIMSLGFCEGIMRVDQTSQGGVTIKNNSEDLYAVVRESLASNPRIVALLDKREKTPNKPVEPTAPSGRGSP